MSEFDFVIVGGGTAASLLAFRLSEDGSHTVCILEAGPPDDNPYIRIPAGFIKTWFNPDITWQFTLEDSVGTGGRRIVVPQGRTLGGSSAINGMIYNRGQAADFDSWAQLGNPGWSYPDILPYFRRTESRIGSGDDRYRGRAGPLPVTTTRWRHPLCDAFFEAALQAGYPNNPDYNGATQWGAGHFQSSIKNGRRQSAAHAFLHPALRRDSVSVRTNAPVGRILFQGKRAVGVALLSDGSQTEQVRARKAVIVSAGALNSPKLLQLSGLGPAALLQAHGIEPVHDLPGVGANLRDHFGSRIVAKVTGADSVNSRVTGWRLGAELVKWLLARPSVLGNSPGIVHAFGKSDPVFDAPDFYLTFIPASFKAGFIGRLDDYAGITCGASPMRPESRGTVRITSSDPRVQPMVQPNYLAEASDQRIAIAAGRAVRTILAAPAMKPYIAAETVPGPDVQTDEEWLDFIRHNGMSGYHFCGTCKMGPATDPHAVVDNRLRVHGIEALHVVDASIMPRTPSANTMAATYMIAEKASDMLRDRPPLPAAIL